MTKVIYIWDAYCGWCYGFGKPLAEFLDNHPEFDVDVVSGGLFIGDRTQAMANLPYITKANEHIAETFGVKFGSGYQQLLAHGGYVMNSAHPAAVIVEVKKYLKNRPLFDFAKAMQEVFYQKGLDLSQSVNYLPLLAQFGLSDQISQTRLNEVLAEASMINTDFALARQFGVQRYPTLILEHEGEYYNLRQDAMSNNELEQNLNAIFNL